MKKTTKIIISLAAAIVIAAAVLTVSIITSSEKKENESTTKYSLQSTTLPSTTVLQETESWVDLDQIASDLATATESDASTETTIPVPSFSVAPQTTIVYVYVSEVTQATTTSPNNKPNNNGPEMTEYKYTVNSEAGTVTINRYLGNDSTIILPKTISGYPVTAIADRCFEGENIKAIGIQEGVTSIGKSAFKNCKKLESVSFLGVPYSVTVGDNAFEGCSKLKNINLPAAKAIGSYAFLGCTSLETLTLKQGTETIGDACFENCSGLKEIVIPSSVSAIGTGVFSGHNDKLVVKCVEGSVAHQVANKYELSVDYIIE